VYVHPVMALLALTVAGLAGAAIAFIWTNTEIGRGSKVEQTVLALAYAASLLIFFLGMFEGSATRWALPVAIMIMGSGTAWANWRGGTVFWIVFGVMAVLGGLSTLVMQLYFPTLSMGVFLVLNVPWLALMVWLVFMIAYKTWIQMAARRRKS